jgi:hypothetical protein
MRFEEPCLELGRAVLPAQVAGRRCNFHVASGVVYDLFPVVLPRSHNLRAPGARRMQQRSTQERV